MGKNLLSIKDLNHFEINQVLDLATCSDSQHATNQPLQNKNAAMLFEKPSLRTKISFDIAIHQLGGHAIYFGQDEIGLGARESVEDIAKVLERYVDIIIARVFSHDSLERMAEVTSAPVINALSDREHPCQALADLLTIRTHVGRLEGVKVAFVGDSNNVARSLALGCAIMGAPFTLVAPKGYQFTANDVLEIDKIYSDNGHPFSIKMISEPVAGVTGADVVYTDVWTSMGQESESELRRASFQNYQVNNELMANAAPGAIFMHDLPARYGEEIATGMLDHKQSVVFDQAENRLHAQKAALRLLFADG